MAMAISDSMQDPHDPITIEIIQSSLRAITDEMFATMRKTAMSSIIYEVLDFGVALMDENGDLASTGAGIPGFVGMLEPGVKAIIKKFPSEQIAAGDVFILNVPHHGGVSHMNDVVLIIPVFFGDVLLGWLANKAHWVDLGGAFPGGISLDATEIYQEGLQLPGVKIISRGEPNQAVLDIIAANSRVPETTLGDFWGGIASMRAGERRFVALAEKYGVDAVLFAIEDYIALGESISRAALKKLPKGTFTADDVTDDGRPIKCAITITDDEFIIDMRGNPKQSSNSLNACSDSTYVDAMMIFKSVVEPQSFANSGSFKPLTLMVDQGSMFAADYPAAMSVYYEVAVLTFDLLWKALAPAMPEYLTAGHYASICGTFIGGPHPEDGKYHTIVEPQLGGWGASRDCDGLNALYTGFHGDTFNVPVEVAEQRNGIMIDRLALSDEPGGEGEFIGGKGINLDYRIMNDDWWITMAYVRSENGPWAMEGGRQGSTNYIKVKRAETGEETRYSSCTALPLKKGDIIQVVSANGGGYGDPAGRSAEQVREDIKNGYLTAERAQEVYGAAESVDAASASSTDKRGVLNGLFSKR